MRPNYRALRRRPNRERNDDTEIEWEELRSITVLEDGDPTATGVLDKRGNEFYRTFDRVSMGFKGGR